jgi:hypothetical protein
MHLQTPDAVARENGQLWTNSVRLNRDTQWQWQEASVVVWTFSSALSLPSVTQLPGEPLCGGLTHPFSAPPTIRITYCFLKTAAWFIGYLTALCQLKILHKVKCDEEYASGTYYIVFNIQKHRLCIESCQNCELLKVSLKHYLEKYTGYKKSLDSNRKSLTVHSLRFSSPWMSAIFWDIQDISCLFGTRKIIAMLINYCSLTLSKVHLVNNYASYSYGINVSVILQLSFNWRFTVRILY